jgi:SAM-dependent methyltransferase
MLQDDVFLEDEGNAWFQRNRVALEASAQDRHDWPLTMIGRLDEARRTGIGSVVELGCSNGWRLARLGKTLPARLVGVDASADAVADGVARYPGLSLLQGGLADLPLREQFDLTIVFFVLHWIDRSNVARCIAEIDRVTRDGGLLVLGDFLPDYPQRRSYHHRPPEAGMFTYKQDYAKIFEAMGTYREIARSTFDHEHPGDHIKTAASGSRCVCTVLQKSLTGFYGEPA